MEWFESLKAKYTAGVAHCFLLHGAVDDYVAPGISLKDFLSKALSSRDLLIFYNISEGIIFPLPSMCKNFMRWLKLDAAPQDPVAQALRGQTPQKDGSETPPPRNPMEALPLLEQALTLDQVKTDTGESQEVKCAVVVNFAEALLPTGDMAMLSPQDRAAVVAIQRWASSKAIAEKSNIIILIARDLTQIHADVRAASSKIAAIHLPLPDYNARLGYIGYLTSLKEKSLTLVPDVTEKALASASAGLSLYQVEDIKLRAEAEDAAVNLDMVKERKTEIFRQEYQEVLEILEPRAGGFKSIGGYEYVKTPLRRIVEKLRRGTTERLPKGVLLLGPAGTGKTEFAKALAKEAGVNCVRFNVGRILGKYVGESEAKLDRSLSGLISLAPCIAFIDELDQQTGRGESGANEVEKRVFARLLEVMGDPKLRGKMIWIAASNRPDLINAAIKRSGRLDYKIVVPPPSGEDRLEIIAVQLADQGAPPTLDIEALGQADRREIIERTEGWTGAELEKLVNKALDLADEENENAPLTLDHLRVALNVIRPSTKNIQFMTKLALAEVDDLTLLPPQYRSLYDNREETVDREAEELTRTRGPRTL